VGKAGISLTVPIDDLSDYCSDLTDQIKTYSNNSKQQVSVAIVAAVLLAQASNISKDWMMDRVEEIWRIAVEENGNQQQ
jgi:hypothetical protein